MRQGTWTTSAVLLSVALAAALLCTAHAGEDPLVKVHDRIAPLAGSMSMPCVSIRGLHGRAFILLSRKTLDALASGKPPAFLKPGEPTDFADERSQEILNALTVVRGHWGCIKAWDPLPRDAVYLVGMLLKHGQATVVDAKTGRLADHVLVREVDTPVMGGESFLIQGEPPIWAYETYVH